VSKLEKNRTNPVANWGSIADKINEEHYVCHENAKRCVSGALWVFANPFWVVPHLQVLFAAQ
jgi:hypothetical protein